MYYLAYLQMASDMEQQIPVISVPMPGKNPTERTVNCREALERLEDGSLFQVDIELLSNQQT